MNAKKNTTEQGCFFGFYLKKIYIPPSAKNSTPTTNTVVGKIFAKSNDVVPFPLIFLCCFAKLIAFIWIEGVKIKTNSKTKIPKPMFTCHELATNTNAIK